MTYSFPRVGYRESRYPTEFELANDHSAAIEEIDARTNFGDTMATDEFGVTDVDSTAMLTQVLDAGHGVAVPAVAGSSHVTYDGTDVQVSSSGDNLVGWTAGEMYQLLTTTITAGVWISSTVKWPDGSTGTLTITTWNATWQCPDAYTITHTTSSKTVTQAAVTRDASGNATTIPALTVA